MELQILDCDYVLVNNKPVVRLFCKNMEGESICVFYDKFFPYFYLHSVQGNYETVITEIRRKFPTLKFEIVEKSLPIGYQPPAKVLKIIGTEPGQTPEIKELAKQFGTPYEADILFKYRFMADFGLKGMSWIDVSGKFTKTSTVKGKCLIADSIKPIENPKNAPLKYLAIDIECLPDEPRIAVPEKDKIIAISMVFNPMYKGKDSLVILAKHTKGLTGNVIACADEKEMLQKMKDVIDDYDADIIAGYNINGFDLPFILKRMEINKVPRDLGKCDKPVFSRKLQLSYATTIVGRVVVDAFEIIKKDPWVKFKRYDLDTVAKQMIGVGKTSLKGKNFLERLRETWNSNLQELVDYAKMDSELVMRIIIEKRLLDKFFEISKVCGLLMQDCLGGQSQRHEFRLLKEFYNRNMIMPCKPERATETGEGGQNLKGAFVLEPDVGFHEWIIVLDFTSMYPSLIRAFNICPTTLMLTEGKDEHITAPNGAMFVKPSVFKGVLPSLVDEFLGARVVAKKAMEQATDPEEKRLYKAKSLALKDLSNSLYGYTGYSRSRLYVMDIASAITSLGRDTIAKTKAMIESNYPVKVIYADTDSVFIKVLSGQINDLDSAEKIGREIAKFVTGNLPGMDLKFEKIFKTFLIEAKKRYAGWAFEKDHDKWVDKLDMKGIETVRRDWCSLVSQTMLEVLNTVLKEKDVKKASKRVREVISDLAKGKVPVEKLSVVKGITKSIDQYDGVQAHVELAKKIIQRDKTRQIIGERLEYVIVKGNQLVSKRAEDPEYVKEKHLEIDSEYYVYNQLLPPLERIFEVCGITPSELLEGVKQKNLMDMFGVAVKKQLSPDETVLNNFESVVCKNCGWEFRRPTLAGNCPKCQGQLYFACSGNMGKTVNISNKQAC